MRIREVQVVLASGKVQENKDVNGFETFFAVQENLMLNFKTAHKPGRMHFLF